MNAETVIIIAEDDEGHATLITKNLRRSGISNRIMVFGDGQEVLDFFFGTGEGNGREPGTPYLLLLDIRMPKVDGVEVLRRIKEDGCMKKVPVIMVTTTDDPKEVENCHQLGCSNYITKPIDYGRFVDAIVQLGQFLQQIEVPRIEGGAAR